MRYSKGRNLVQLMCGVGIGIGVGIGVPVELKQAQNMLRKLKVGQKVSIVHLTYAWVDERRRRRQAEESCAEKTTALSRAQRHFFQEHEALREIGAFV